MVSFERFIICQQCHCLYTSDQCIEKVGSILKPKVCSNVLHSKTCGGPLLRKVITISRNNTLYPYRVCCYHSVITTLQHLFLRPGFVSLCESTRNNVSESQSRLLDAFQGKIWKEFLQVDGNAFLSEPFTYGFILNIDWFQPFEHYTYSVGVIYLAVINLPRYVRYRRENIILVGIIPGPSEPPLTVNIYLSPLVSELLQLWSGVLLHVFGSTSQENVRAALLGFACDLPAGRKVCGFLGHSANLGCSRCFTEFSRGFGQLDYSDMNRDSWKMRTNKKHRADVKKLAQCENKTNLHKMECELGCRFSVLLHLPYFDPVRMLIVDPMHNLFLGTAKHITRKVWIGRGILTHLKLDIIHQRLQRIQLPIHIGRLPVRIDSGATFTAEQWMNWTIYFSIYCLFDLLSTDEIECWRHFVLACRRLCQKTLTQEDITVADALLMRFLRRVKLLYGESTITPNIHMHAHLASCLRDYGPSHVFWLFAFERFNGLLGSQPHNNRSIEIQLMNRFLNDNMHLELMQRAETKPLADVFGNVVTLHASHSNSDSDLSIDSSSSVL